MNTPKHIAIIMDGNGRWAKKRGLPRIFGHREGARNVKRMATACSNLGIEILTIYGFSVENWNRPEREVSLLMKLMKVYSGVGRKLCMENNVRFDLIGEIEKLPDFLKEGLLKLKDLTKQNTGMLLQAALSYGGRDEITRAVKKIATDVKEGKLLPEEINEELISKSLDTKGQTDPDLVIRTSGEYRISNYLLWQSAYAEFYFTDVLWPDFSEAELQKAIESFNARERRFGGVEILKEQKIQGSIL
ncbi:MAG: undecaprenyl diphosphate synthase [Bacteriovoracaceae bacterium]|nr:undecaprenyl diphosphate synthase [Bacteriovoracaceae bacterium]